MTERFVRTIVLLSFTAVLVISLGFTIDAQEQGNHADAGVKQENQEEPGLPRRHVRIWQVADLDPNEANRIYEIIRGALAKGYASVSIEGIEDYQALRRFNTAPYLSSAHGKHYLNNYANETARRYGEFENVGRLPVGSVLYKDSFSVTQSRQDFSVTDSRQIVLGPLFIMRKMEAGFNNLTGDWQYIQIQPDGTLLGMTGGDGADRVEYCIGCHLAREEYDHLYFIPDSYRP